MHDNGQDSDQEQFWASNIFISWNEKKLNGSLRRLIDLRDRMVLLIISEPSLNIGISEQNMVGVAAGLAREGFVVFTAICHSIYTKVLRTDSSLVWDYGREY